LRALLRVAIAATLVVLSFSMLTPVLAVRLQKAGESTSAIGAFAMLTFLSVALMVPLMPRVFARLGVARAYRLGLMLEAAATLGYALTDRYGWWCVLSVLAGVGAAAAWNGAEALIAYNAPPERRGRFTGMYQTALGGALALGPFLPSLLPLSPRALTVLAAAALLLAIAVTLSPGVSQLRASRVGAASMGLTAALRRVPGLAWVACAGGMFEVGLTAVSSAYGSKLGLSLASAASIAGVLGAGSFLLQYPSGWLADHVAPRRVFASAGWLLVAGSLSFAWVTQWHSLLWVSAFVWGAVGGSLYTLTMIRVAHEFADSSAVAGAAAMIVSYTLGGAIGPAFSGWMLDRFGVVGQAAWLSVMALSVVWAAWRMSAGARSARA